MSPQLYIDDEVQAAIDVTEDESAENEMEEENNNDISEHVPDTSKTQAQSMHTDEYVTRNNGNAQSHQSVINDFINLPEVGLSHEAKNNLLQKILEVKLKLERLMRSLIVLFLSC